MDLDLILEKTKKELRSLLISAPRGVAVALLAKDYRMVMGKELPYRDFGYGNIEHFIKAIPDTIRLGQGPAGLTCYAVANAETQQIARFVAAQKKPALKKSLKPPPVVVRKPTKTYGFTKKSHFGPGGSRTKKFFNVHDGGGNPFANRQPYVPAGQHIQHSTGGSKFGKPFHAKQQAPASNLPPRMVRSSTSAYDVPSIGGAAYMTRPSSAGSIRTLLPKPATLPVKQLGSQSKQGISPIRYPSQQMKKQPSKGVYPWKKELEASQLVTINFLNQQHLAGIKVCTTGYIASLPITCEEPRGLLIKRLLFTDYSKPAGRGLAVLLVFKSPKNLVSEEFSDAICGLKEGTKLKVYGECFVHVNRKKNSKKEPGIDVWYYEKSDESVSNGLSHTNSSPLSSRSVSPLSSQPSTSQMSPGSRSSLEQEIIKVLRDRTNGVYGKRLGKEYESVFKKSAPPDIMEFAASLPFVQVEEIVAGTAIFSLIESKAPGSTQPVKDNTKVSVATKSAVSAPTTPVSRTVKFIEEEPFVPGTVELGGAGEVCDVQVVFIESVLSFYVQKLGKEFFDQFRLMEKNMSAHLSHKAEFPPSALAENTLYAMRWNDEESGGGEEIWCRVLIRSITRDQDTAFVLCPDFGNSLRVSKSELKYLPKQFCELPFQAVHCCLHGFRGMDYIAEDEAYKAFERRALYKSCIAQVMENSGSRALVELIDSESDGQETINSLLLQELLSESKLAPVLPQPGAQRVPTKLVDIDMDGGVVTVQLVGPGLDQLEHLMTIINEAYKKPRAADFIRKVEKGMVCCAVFSLDRKWYRALVKEAGQSEKIMVEFVDYGNEEVVDKNKLRKGLDHHLFKLPFQAVKCTLHGLPPPQGQWTAGAIDVVMDFLDCDDMYLQVIEPGLPSVGQLPAVRLVVDNGEEEEIIDLNDRLLSDPQLFGLRRQSSSDLSDVEAAPVQPPVISSTPDKTSHDETAGTASSDSSVSEALSGICDGVKSLKLSESVHQNDKVASVGEIGNDSKITPEQVPNVECSAISLVVNTSSTPAALELENTISGISENTINLQGASLSLLEQDASSLMASKEDENTDVVGKNNNNSVQLLEVENVLTPPPSSSESNFVFSPHTPSGSPSYLGRGSSPLEGSPTHLVQSPLTPKVVGVDSSSSLSSLGAVSPHTPQISPHAGSTHVHFVIGSGGKTNGVDNIAVVKSGLNFQPLEVKSTVPVMISWAASPNNFTIQLFNNMNALDSLTSNLTEEMDAAGSTNTSSSLVILPGLVCGALSEDLWYRVLVLEPPVVAGGGGGSDNSSGGYVKVEFLDYGGTEQVAESSLRLLPEKFLELPFQGISSSLYNISPCVEGQGWSFEAVEYFESLYTDKQLFAVVHSKETVNTQVYLLDTVSIQGKTLNLGQELVTKGFAKMKNP